MFATYTMHTACLLLMGVLFWAQPPEEGFRIAAALGQGRAVTLMNRRLLTVGSTVDEPAYLLPLIERSCQV
jgi:hypothetical protein